VALYIFVMRVSDCPWPGVGAGRGGEEMRAVSISSLRNNFKEDPDT
jgi:hypothetical protein